MESTPAASPAAFAIPKVVKPSPNIHHAGVVRLSMAPALIKSKGPSEVAKSGVSLFSSKSRLHTFLVGGQVWDKRKQYNLFNPASHLRNITFCKV